VVFSEQAAESPEASSEVHVRATGQRWLWRYEYLDEGEQGSAPFSYGELVVPAGARVLLDVESSDVIHGWQVPALGGNVLAVPGTSNRAVFVADEEGTYRGRSTVYSGPAYPTMRTTVRAVSPLAYKRWIRMQRRAIEVGQVAVRTALEAQRAGARGAS
jgi:cytochrome c oxidase subunit 2